MHPYRMQQLIKERGKDLVINVQRRASLYQTPTAASERTDRGQGDFPRREPAESEAGPELTEKGLQTAREWLRDMLETPKAEFPEFPAALSLIPLLESDDVIHRLEEREAALAEKLSRLDSILHQEAADLPRLFLLEIEYLHSMLETEVKWVRSLIDDLRSGRIAWDEEWLRSFADAEEG